MKKGVIWVSAVLYIALGMIIITLILSAGVPVINKLRDRNTVAQTKTVMYNVDENVRAVASEGPGSKRVISLNVERGDFIVDSYDNLIKWKMKTKNRMMEPNINFKEGVLDIYLNETIIEEEYLINLDLNYKNFADIYLDSVYGNPFSGTYTMSIRHNGSYSDGVPVVVVNLM